MKWSILFGAAFALSIQLASAQRPDTAQLSVHYIFTHVRDTNNRKHPYTEKMVLLVGKNSGVYKSGDRHVEQHTTTNPDGSTRTDTHGFGSATEYYQYPNEKKMLHKDRLPMTDFLMATPLPVIAWHITGDTATLGGLHCQKATTHFRGRDYTAWFCPDWPLHIGPWKLNGLPGVIVQAYDAKDEVRFMFDGVGKTEPEAIVAPTKGVPTTEKEFDRLGETARKDPEAFAKLMASFDGGPGGGPKMKFDLAPAPPFNNPIELPEKK